MADRLKEELGRLLDGYDERRRVAEVRERQVKADDARFLSEFAELRRTVVRPAFESAGAVLAARGHNFSIAEHEFEHDASGKPSEARITFSIAPSGTQPLLHSGDAARSLSFTTRHYNKTLWIDAGMAPNAAGLIGTKRACALKDVDRQVVEDEILKFVASLIAG